MLPAYKRTRRILEAKHRELEAELASYDCIQAIRVADEIDDISLAVDREMATMNLERRSILIRQIAGSLARLEDGTYGLCVSCGLPIAAVRLDSVPWTPHCIRCQEIAEREHQQNATAVLGE